MIYKLKDQTFIVAVFFSLCLHGLLACFLIPSVPNASLERISTIQVVWEKEGPPSEDHSRRYVKPEKPSPTKENRIHKAPSQIKKVNYNLPISNDSYTRGENEGKKNSSPKPTFKMTVNRKPHHPLPRSPPS